MNSRVNTRNNKFNRPHHAKWIGGLPIGLLHGARYFLVHPNDSGSKLTTGDDFSGPLLKLMSCVVPDWQESFEKLAANLKAEVERG